MKKITGKILVPGGVLSPGELRKIVNTAHYYHTGSITFGNRQEILVSINANFLDEIHRRLSGGQYHFTTDQSVSNIVTSFVSRNVFHSTPWLTEGVYLEILASFTRESSLKINITDPQQSFGQPRRRSSESSMATSVAIGCSFKNSRTYSAGS